MFIATVQQAKGSFFFFKDNASRMIPAEKGFPCAGKIILAPWSNSDSQLSFNFTGSSAKMGKPGLKRKGNLFIAISPTKASPVSNRTLTDPEEWPGV
jgi:hypothetical protein